jgi:hypothetical protein
MRDKKVIQMSRIKYGWKWERMSRKINYLSLPDLIKSKSAVKRVIDREDIKALHQIAKRNR